MSHSILKADPGRQRIVLVVAALLTGITLRAAYGVARTLDQIRQIAVLDSRRASKKAVELTDLYLWVGSIALALIGIYLIVQGIRILRTGQHPLPGAKVVFDTRVSRGLAARRRAIVGILLGVVLVVGAIWLTSDGRRQIRKAVVLPEPESVRQVSPFDPDGFSQPVPGALLVDPRDPRHPMNQKPAPDDE